MPPGSLDLDPFARARHAAGLKRHHVAPRELQVGRRGHRQAQGDAVAADAGEHPVADEVGVEAVDFLRDHAGKFQEHCVDLRLAAGIG
jgi:hypothetical protein